MDPQVTPVKGSNQGKKYHVDGKSVLLTGATGSNGPHVLCHVMERIRLKQEKRPVNKQQSLHHVLEINLSRKEIVEETLVPVKA